MPLAQPAPQAVPDWAVDFQRLNISAAAPFAPESVTAAPLLAAGSIVASSSRPAQTFAPAFESSYSYLGHGYGPGVGMGYMEQQEQAMGYMEMPQQSGMAFDGGLAFDTEAFERAFDIAAAEVKQLDIEAMQPESEYQALMRSDEELDQIMSEVQASGEVTATHEMDIASAVAPQPAVQEEAPQNEALNDEGDQLSRTAKQLLESVSHETSDKFAQSSFLGLMRRLRDKEVHVEGEDFIEVCATDVRGNAHENSHQPTTLQTLRAWPAP
jgi:uncharacterized protein YjgD (DUF1641 family)